MLEKTSSTPVAEGYQRLLEALDEFRVLNNSAALLIIDPQRSFTQGVWMQSMGTEAAAEITPIAAAFTNCSKLLKEGIYEGLLANFNSDGSWHPKSPCTKTIY